MEDRVIPPSPDPSSPLTPPPPAFTLADLKAMMESRARDGWRWDEEAHILAHPHDRLLHFHIDPDTHRLSLSPELARQLLRQHARPPEETQP